MTNAPLRRKSRPNDLKYSPVKHSSGFIKPRPGVVFDRTTQDLLINAQVVAVEIIDPFGDPALVLRSTRNDPLADMRSRDQIEECDYAAGRRWQDAYESSQIGSVRAIDPSKEAVDGGKSPEVLTDRQLRGAKDVNAVRAALGLVGHALVQDVLGEGLSITLAAKKRGMGGERDRRFLGARFRECLATMALLFGLAMKPKRI